jgi:hypothetical protein
MKSKSIVIGLGTLGCFVIGAIIYAQVISNNSPSIPTIEVNARFANADQNGDGVLCKEEFANYFAKTQQVNFTANNTAESASESGCCGGEEAGNVKIAKVKTVDVKSSEKSCCSEGKKAETIQVKLSKEGDAKESGCCGGKDKAKTTDAKIVDVKSGEKSCCSEGKKAETAEVKGDNNDVKKTTDATKQNEVKSDAELQPVVVVDVKSVDSVKSDVVIDTNNANDKQ